MKIAKLIVRFLPVAVLLLSSCIKEDTSDCLFDIRLTFKYLGDDQDITMFQQKIERVTVLVYDRAGNHLETRVVEKSQLDFSPGIGLTLDPGEYRVVCWGNVFDDAELSGIEKLTTGRIHHPNFIRQSVIPTSDHLYYGNQDIKVSAIGNSNHEVIFRGAHINMMIYVRYYLANNPVENLPVVKVHNLMPQYDMNMASAQPFETTYEPLPGYNTEHNANEYLLQTLLFGDDNPVRIDIQMQSGKSHVIHLKDYMAANNISVAGKNEASIPILIEFNDLGVNISVPEWESVWVDPEIE